MTEEQKNDLSPGYVTARELARYGCTTVRKIALFRKYGLLKYAKFGREYVFKTQWFDQFAEEWQGCDLSNEQMIMMAVDSRRWKEKQEKKRTGGKH